MNTNDTSDRILYAGDTSLRGAAAYLAGVLHHRGHRVDYVDSATPLSAVAAETQHRLYILSDYPADKLNAGDFQRILDGVRAGAGLLMIGGWESFHGLGGNYDATPLAEALPVTIATEDDRRNVATPCVVEKVMEHPVTCSLPFEIPPTIGGYNAFTPKPEGRTLLAARRLEVRMRAPGDYAFAAGAADPLLVVGAYGGGRTAAYAGDVAPHWVGGLVDWGSARVAAQAPGANDVEVGELYAEFFDRLVRWTAGLLGE